MVISAHKNSPEAADPFTQVQAPIGPMLHNILLDSSHAGTPSTSRHMQPVSAAHGGCNRAGRTRSPLRVRCRPPVLSRRLTASRAISGPLRSGPHDPIGHGSTSLANPVNDPTFNSPKARLRPQGRTHNVNNTFSSYTPVNLSIVRITGL